MKRLYLLVFLGAFMASSSLAQRLYSRHELLSDLDSLYVMISEIHPDMYANITPGDYERKFMKAKESITDPMTRLEFYRIAAPLVSCFNDGHTLLNFAWADMQSKDVSHFPLSLNVRHKEKKLVIAGSFSDTVTDIPNDAVIRSVNGMQAADIIEGLYSMVSAERGHFKESTINQMSFVFMAPLFFGDTLFKIEFEFQEERFSKTLKGVTYRQIYQALQNNQTDAQPHDYYLSVDSENEIATIHLNLFWDLDKFTLFLDSAFRIIQAMKISDLIIDI